MCERLADVGAGDDAVNVAVLADYQRDRIRVALEGERDFVEGRGGLEGLHQRRHRVGDAQLCHDVRGLGFIVDHDA